MLNGCASNLEKISRFVGGKKGTFDYINWAKERFCKVKT
jgi:hypothetical protein